MPNLYRQPMPKVKKKNQDKLKLSLFLLILTFLAILTGVTLAKSRLKNQGKSQKMEIEGVTLNNFLKENESKEYVSIEKNQDYHIFYLPKYKTFYISITGSDFEKIKNIAEEKFLQLLGIKASEACKLKVYITTPFFANPDKSGTTYKLSFCK